MKKESFLIAAFVAVALTAGPAMGAVTGTIDFCTPSFVLPLGANDAGSAGSTVTITDDPTSGDVDVFFLTDTTGSMGSFLSSVKSVFSGVLTNLRTDPDLAGVDWRWGVANYRDFEDGGDWASGVQVNQTLTSNDTDAANAINGLSVGGGGDLPEQNLAALRNIANDWVSANNGRPTAQKIAVWTGDIQGWENGAKGHPYPTLQATIDDLVAQGVQVYGLNNNSAGFGIDAPGSSASPGGPIDGRNQASAIGAGTGGQALNNVNFGDPASVAAVIENAIVTGVETVGIIEMQIAGDLGDWTLNVTGTPVIGPFGSGDSPVISGFGLEATAPGYVDSRTVDLVLKLDGSTTATCAIDLIAVPEPAALSLLSLGGIALLRRRRRT